MAGRRSRVCLGIVFLTVAACSGGSSPPPTPFDDVEKEPPYVKVVRSGGVVERTADGGVVLRGRILSERGKPVSGVFIQLEKDITGFGPIACFFGCRLPPPCSDGDAARSDRAGRFLLQMCKPAGRDLTLALSKEPTKTTEIGTGITIPLFLKHNRMPLPRLRFWDGKISFDASTGTLVWSDLPRRGFGALNRYQVAARSDEQGLDPMWFEFDGFSGDTVDPRVFEDTSGELFVTAYTQAQVRGGCGGKCRLELQLTSEGVRYRGPGAPPSRGTTCFVGKPGGPSLQGCYLNDGDFFRELFDYPCSTQLDCGFEGKRAVVDLGKVIRVELIVVRGCDFCHVWVSADGRSWRSVEETDSDESLHLVSVRDPASPIRARYVRVDDAEYVMELSVWPR